MPAPTPTPSPWYPTQPAAQPVLLALALAPALTPTPALPPPAVAADAPSAAADPTAGPSPDPLAAATATLLRAPDPDPRRPNPADAPSHTVGPPAGDPPCPPHPLLVGHAIAPTIPAPPDARSPAPSPLRLAANGTPTLAETEATPGPSLDPFPLLHVAPPEEPLGTQSLGRLLLPAGGSKGVSPGLDHVLVLLNVVPRLVVVLPVTLLSRVRALALLPRRAVVAAVAVAMLLLVVGDTLTRCPRQGLRRPDGVGLRLGHLPVGCAIRVGKSCM